MDKKKPSVSFWKSFRLGLIVLIVLMIYAYGVQVTKVDLQEFRKESRQQSRVRVTRALVQPDIVEYTQEEFHVIAPIYIPCPTNGLGLPAPDKTKSYIVLTPACGNPGENIQVEGFEFTPNTHGPLSFIPSSDPNNSLALKKADIQIDAQGHFVLTMTLPDRSSPDVQYLRATTRRNVGAPHFSQTAIDTWSKIIETVFLALLATTIGVIFSIPLSFLAARNIMKDVKSPLTSMALTLLGWPVGIGIGFYVSRWIGNFAWKFEINNYSTISVALICLIIALLMVRWIVFREDENPSGSSTQIVRVFFQLVVVVLSLLSINLLAKWGVVTGKASISALGVGALLGNFLAQISDITLVILPSVVALVGGAVLGGALGKLGQRFNEKFAIRTVKILNILLTALAGLTVFGLIASVLNWLYEIRAASQFLWIMGGIGAVLGGCLAFWIKAKQPVAVGLAVYYITRTILNATRSVEALIMAIVAVIWVGIGPFAGVLALSLHTIASLAKLYSEQVESIMPGPLEAINATGATRVQTIVYGVIPQIVPPYISFTMYRWDINVRMSTIIGFAGGGGIGSLLIQNINLLNYRAASTQMLAIAIVVSLMDYLSSAMRERSV